MRATGCNQCWYSPFIGGPHQYVWVGYKMHTSKFLRRGRGAWMGSLTRLSVNAPLNTRPTYEYVANWFKPLGYCHVVVISPLLSTNQVQKYYTKYCIEWHQFNLSCSILTVKPPCVVSPTPKRKANTISHS